MKTITLPRVVITLITIALFAVVLKSCKKVDKNAVNTKDTDAIASVQKAIREKYGDISGGIIIPVNKSADEYFYRNVSGNMTSLFGNLNSRTGINGPSVCKANCTTTSNPADLRIIYTLDYVQRFYMCEGNSDKSTVNVKWTVSVPFQIGYTLNNFPALHYGDVVFKNSSGTVINTLTATNGQVTSTMLGADPSCPTWNNLWEVTYTFTQVTNSNFVSGNTIEASISLENDCGLVGNVVVSGYVSAPTIFQDAYLPCNRIDAVFINPPSGSGFPYSVVGLYTITCNPPSGMQGIDYHQLEYRKINSGSGSEKWDDQTTAVYNGWPQPANTASSPTIYPYGGTSNLVNMVWGAPSSTGYWLVRWRNVKTGTCDIISDATNTLNQGGDANTNANWGNTALWVVQKCYVP